ncbi:type VI secretion system baseplate subunit TssK [Chitinibacteraceae bacterium HSL-7]
MSAIHRVLWGEGMFLRPQHFQQQALFHEHQLADRLAQLHRHGWGLLALELDEAGLNAGHVRLDRLDLAFRDGAVFRSPQQAPLPLQRDLSEAGINGTETTLYACLPQLQPYGGNVGSGENRASRYASNAQQLSDLYTQALEADVSTMSLNVRLMFEHENRDGHESIAIARLVRTPAGQWQADADFLPPQVTVTAHPWTARALRRLLDILSVKSQSLAGSHREKASKVVEFGSSDIGTFWLLHTVNRNFARLQHLATCQPLHPEELYRALIEFAGELQTFSSVFSLADLPPYRHDALTDTLPVLDQQIRELLETVISARYLQIPLSTPKPSFFIGRLESDRLLDGADFFLSVQSGSMSAAQIIDMLPYKLKLGAPDDVEKILNSAMRGVGVVHCAQTPAALPVRVGNLYFSIESKGDLYQRMLQAHSICLYLPQTLADIKVELFAVFR